MAKWNREQIGSVTKKSEDKQRFSDVKEFSIKITKDITLKAGEYLNLENKAFKLASLRAAQEKMSPEVFEKLVTAAEKMPEWCVFEIIKLKKED